MLFPFFAFDVAIEPVAQVTGINPLLLFVPIVILEALALWLLRWGTLGRSAAASFAANAVSTFAGVLLQLDFEHPLIWAFLLSVGLEGVVLMLFNRRRKGRSWACALAVNILSYALITVLLVTRG